MSETKWCYRCRIAVSAPCDDLCDYWDWPAEDLDDDSDPGEWDDDDIAAGLDSAHQGSGSDRP